MKTDKRTTKGVRGTAVAGLRSVLRSPIWLLIALGLMAWVSHPAEGMDKMEMRRHMDKMEMRRQMHNNIIFPPTRPPTYLSEQDKKILELSIHNEKMKLIKHFQKQIPKIDDTESDRNEKQEIARLLTGIMGTTISASDFDESLLMLNEYWKNSEKPKICNTDTLKKNLHQMQDELLQRFRSHKTLAMKEAYKPIISEALDYLGVPKIDIIELKSFRDWNDVDFYACTKNAELIKRSCDVVRIQKEAEGPYTKHLGVDNLQQFARDFHSLFPAAKSEKQKALHKKQILLLLDSATVLNSADLESNEKKQDEIALSIAMINRFLGLIRKNLREKEKQKEEKLRLARKAAAEKAKEELRLAREAAAEEEEEELRLVREAAAEKAKEVLRLTQEAAGEKAKEELLDETYLEDQQEALQQLIKEYSQVNLEATRTEKKIDLTNRVIEYYLAILRSAGKGSTGQDKDEDESLPKGEWEELRSDDPDKNTFFDLAIESPSPGDCEAVHTGIRSVTLVEDTKKASDEYLKAVNKTSTCVACPGIQVERGEKINSTPYSKKWWHEKYYNFYYTKKEVEGRLWSRTRVAHLAAHRREKDLNRSKHGNFPKLDQVASVIPKNFPKSERIETNQDVKDFKMEFQKKPEWKELHNTLNPGLPNFMQSYTDVLGEVRRAKVLTDKVLKSQAGSEKKEAGVEIENHEAAKTAVYGQPGMGAHSWERGITCFSILSVVTVICILLTMLFFLKSRRGPQTGHVELRDAR